MELPFIRSKVLIISDTHGEEELTSKNIPSADVVIHCGDMTDESKLSEIQATLRLLSVVPAPLKLVIAGNHDFTLDDGTFKHKIYEAMTKFGVEESLLRREFGEIGEARQLIDAAKRDGIIFLDEGVHSFVLANGARLTVYASPYTASPNGDWGFQYSPDEDHAWEIQEGTDIVVTHSPPKGILDYTDSRQRAGSASLFAAVAHAKPKIHCFGHIHEGWGAKLVAWRREDESYDLNGTALSHFTAIDNDQSCVVESLATLKARKFDTEDVVEEKRQRLENHLKNGYCTATSLDEGKYAERTLFVNASIESREDSPAVPQLPWLVEINLPSSR